MKGSQFKHVCFTVNNPANVEFSWPEEIVRYAIWQKERSQQGIYRLKGYVEFNKKMSMRKAKVALGNLAHFEERRGPRDQARANRMKSESLVDGPWEFGHWVIGSAGARDDMDFLGDWLKAGKTEAEIKKEDFGLWKRNYQVIRRYRLLKAKPRHHKTAFHVLIGEPGTGKLMTAQATSPNAFRKRVGKEFDGFDEMQDIIIDEVDQQGISLVDLLHMTDRYPYMIPIRDGFMPFNSSNIYATSSKNIEDWFPNITPNDLASLMRRIDSITTFRWAEGEDTRKIVVRQVVFSPEANASAPVFLDVRDVIPSSTDVKAENLA